jgi:hypothetical protein
LWVNSDGLGVTGTVWSGGVVTGTLQVTGSSPAAGKVLGATDAYGTVAWIDPVTTPPSATPGVYKFNARYWDLMRNAEFRTWFTAQPNGAATIMPAGAGYSNAHGWGNTQNTASKLCQFFTDGGVISFEQVGLGSDNNNYWLYWDTAQNKWRWNYSSWNNSLDVSNVTCFTMKGIARGASFLLGSNENIPFSGGGTNTRDTY